jgi:hypothetical protein
MDSIRSLDEPDPVQRYMQRQALIRCLVLCVIGALLVVAVYWEFFR